MFKSIKNLVFNYIKGNFLFSLGVIFGSVIATITTVMITMGMLGTSEALQRYQKNICGIENESVTEDESYSDYCYGTQVWCQNGKLHWEDGSVIVYPLKRHE